MHSSTIFFLLAAITSVFVVPTLAGDFPLVGVTLLQSHPPFLAFGSVTITQETDGGELLIEGLVINALPNSRFGLHVHEQGDLTNGCISAGAHFNPYSKEHGSEKSIDRHWGDFGNVKSDPLGQIQISLTIPEGSLIGTDGFFGRALVLHEREDDLGLGNDPTSKKTGNSGDRVACGVIGIRRPMDLLPVSQRTQWTTNNQRKTRPEPPVRQ